MRTSTGTFGVCPSSGTATKEHSQSTGIASVPPRFHVAVPETGTLRTPAGAHEAAGVLRSVNPHPPPYSPILRTRPLTHQLFAAIPFPAPTALTFLAKNFVNTWLAAASMCSSILRYESGIATAHWSPCSNLCVYLTHRAPSSRVHAKAQCQVRLENGEKFPWHKRCSTH